MCFITNCNIVFYQDDLIVLSQHTFGCNFSLSEKILRYLFLYICILLVEFSRNEIFLLVMYAYSHSNLLLHFSSNLIMHFSSNMILHSSSKTYSSTPIVLTVTVHPYPFIISSFSFFVPSVQFSLSISQTRQQFQILVKNYYQQIPEVQESLYSFFFQNM